MEQQHLILKHVFDVEVVDQQQAKDIQQALVYEYQEECNRLLDHIFSEIVPSDFFMVIDKLELHLKLEEGKNLFTQMSNQIRTQVSKELRRYWQEIETGSIPAQLPYTDTISQDKPFDQDKDDVSLMSMSIHEARLKAFTHFIEQGIFPWWYAQEGEKTLDSLWRSLLNYDRVKLFHLILSLLSKQAQRQRIALQFSEEQLFQFFDFLGIDHWQLIDTLKSTLSNDAPVLLSIKGMHRMAFTSLDKKIGYLILSLVASRQHADFPSSDDRLYLKTMHQSIPELLSALENPEKSRVESYVEENESTGNPSDSDKFFVAYAGLILLAPYLPQFFSALNWLENGHFKSPEEEAKACLLLHYIATGKTNAEESELLIHKLLCGVDIHVPLPSQGDFSQEEREEADALIDAVILNWTALKNTSRDAFRETFLMREAFLHFKEENGWMLKVDRKGVDILVDMIPWGIGMIRLPWNRYFIHVDW